MLMAVRPHTPGLGQALSDWHVLATGVLVGGGAFARPASPSLSRSRLFLTNPPCPAIRSTSGVAVRLWSHSNPAGSR